MTSGMKMADFLKWTYDNKWLIIRKSEGVEGRIFTFLTPSGNVIIAKSDIAGQLINVSGLVKGG